MLNYIFIPLRCLCLGGIKLKCIGIIYLYLLRLLLPAIKLQLILCILQAGHHLQEDSGEELGKVISEIFRKRRLIGWNLNVFHVIDSPKIGFVSCFGVISLALSYNYDQFHVSSTIKTFMKCMSNSFLSFILFLSLWIDIVIPKMKEWQDCYITMLPLCRVLLYLNK